MVVLVTNGAEMNVERGHRVPIPDKAQQSIRVRGLEWRSGLDMNGKLILNWALVQHLLVVIACSMDMDIIMVLISHMTIRAAATARVMCPAK
jgi:hypothetical protein